MPWATVKIQIHYNIFPGSSLSITDILLWSEFFFGLNHWYMAMLTCRNYISSSGSVRKRAGLRWKQVPGPPAT